MDFINISDSKLDKMLNEKYYGKNLSKEETRIAAENHNASLFSSLGGGKSGKTLNVNPEIAEKINMQRKASEEFIGIRNKNEVKIDTSRRDVRKAMKSDYKNGFTSVSKEESKQNRMKFFNDNKSNIVENNVKPEASVLIKTRENIVTTKEANKYSARTKDIEKNGFTVYKDQRAAEKFISVNSKGDNWYTSEKLEGGGIKVRPYSQEEYQKDSNKAKPKTEVGARIKSERYEAKQLEGIEKQYLNEFANKKANEVVDSKQNFIDKIVDDTKSTMNTTPVTEPANEKISIPNIPGKEVEYTSKRVGDRGKKHVIEKKDFKEAPVTRITGRGAETTHTGVESTNVIDSKRATIDELKIRKEAGIIIENVNKEKLNSGEGIKTNNVEAENNSGAGKIADATEEVKPREFNSPMEKIIAETQYGPAGKTMETSGVFTEDASKYNLKNIAELEANVSAISNKIEKIQNEKTEMKDVVESKWSKFWGGNKQVDLVDEPFKVDSPILKGGTLEGNFGKFGEDADVEKITELGTIKTALNSAKNTLLKESYEPASHGSDVHFERGVIKKLDDVQLTKGLQTQGASDYLKQMSIDDDTKISWSKTEDGGLEGIYKKTRVESKFNTANNEVASEIEESHKLRVNFGKDGAISGFEAQKLEGDKWVNNDAKIDLGNGQQVGIERAKEIAKMNEKQLRNDIIKQNRQAVADGVEGAKSMGTMEELKLKLGKGAKAEEAKTILANAKEAVRSHAEATKVMAGNISEKLGEAGRVDLKAISNAAAGAVEGASKEVGKNTSAMGNNTGKGMTSLLVLAGVGMAFGAVKAAFDNSAEQRRQKQLELMAMRQQYGGAM